MPTGFHPRQLIWAAFVVLTIWKRLWWWTAASTALLLLAFLMSNQRRFQNRPGLSVVAMAVLLLSAIFLLWRGLGEFLARAR